MKNKFVSSMAILSFFLFLGTSQVYADTITPGSVPEPQTMLLLGTGLLGLAIFGRKKFKKK